MSEAKNVFLLKRQKNKRMKNLSIEVNDEIIVDSALIDCMNQLNSLRENESVGTQKSERDVLSQINQISAEMHWFSQWLTAKKNSAAQLIE